MSNNPDYRTKTELLAYLCQGKRDSQKHRDYAQSPGQCYIWQQDTEKTFCSFVNCPERTRNEDIVHCQEQQCCSSKPWQHLEHEHSLQSVKAQLREYLLQVNTLKRQVRETRNLKLTPTLSSQDASLFLTDSVCREFAACNSNIYILYIQYVQESTGRNAQGLNTKRLEVTTTK